VLSTWGYDKVRTHYKQAATPADVSHSAAVRSSECGSITDFLAAFADSLTSDPNLSQVLRDTKTDFTANFNARSSSQLLEMAIVDLLDLFQVLLTASLTLTKELVDGLLNVACDFVAYLFDANDGILTRPLTIPILSDLYRSFVQSELTFLDLMVLVAAIPITFLYRIVEGEWFSDELPEVASPDSTPLARATGLLNGTLLFARGIFQPFADMASMNGTPNVVLFKIMAALNGTLAALATWKAAVSPTDWIVLALGFGLTFAPFFGPPAPTIASSLGVARAGAFIVQKADPSIDISWTSFSGDLLGTLPAVAQPVKYLGDTLPVLSRALVADVDAIGSIGAALVAVVNTVFNWDAALLGDPQSREGASAVNVFVPLVAKEGRP
jgi:hypothetical protein